MTKLLNVADKERIKAEILAECDLIADCWIYKGARNSKGYGIKKIGKKTHAVSRFMLAYETRESIDNPDLEACHKDEVCPYKACCNPLHLYWATKAENCKAREKRKKEERELFTLREHPYSWIDGVLYTEHRDADIDRCLASLNRGKIERKPFQSSTSDFDVVFSEEMAKVFSFLTDIGLQTWERLRGVA